MVILVRLACQCLPGFPCERNNSVRYVRCFLTAGNAFLPDAVGNGIAFFIIDRQFSEGPVRNLRVLPEGKSARIAFLVFNRFRFSAVHTAVQARGDLRHFSRPVHSHAVLFPGFLRGDGGDLNIGDDDAVKRIIAKRDLLTLLIAVNRFAVLLPAFRHGRFRYLVGCSERNTVNEYRALALDGYGKFGNLALTGEIADRTVLHNKIQRLQFHSGRQQHFNMEFKGLLLRGFHACLRNLFGQLQRAKV